MSLHVGDALVALLDWAWPHIEPRVEAAAEFIADAVRPEPPMSIRTLDGETVTGLLVADRGRVLAFIGIRQPPPATAPMRHERFEEPLWPRDVQVDPYRRPP